MDLPKKTVLNLPRKPSLFGRRNETAVVPKKPDKAAAPPAAKPILHSNLPLVEVKEKITLDMMMADPQIRRLIMARHW